MNVTLKDAFLDNARIKLIYFNDEEVSNKEVFFEGTAVELKGRLTQEDWMALRLGDSFLLDKDHVRVFGVNEMRIKKGLVSRVTYYVAPNHLDSLKIKYDKF